MKKSFALPLLLVFSLLSCMSVPKDPVARRARMTPSYETGLDEKSDKTQLSVIYVDVYAENGGVLYKLDEVDQKVRVGKMYVKPGLRKVEFFATRTVGSYEYSASPIVMHNFEIGKEYEATIIFDYATQRVNVTIDEVFQPSAGK